MNKNGKRISARCPLFACRECRTKTGWRHQSWCPFAGLPASDCTQCLYSEQKRSADSVCIHPRMKEREKKKA